MHSTCVYIHVAVCKDYTMHSTCVYIHVAVCKDLFFGFSRVSIKLQKQQKCITYKRKH